MKFKEIEQSYVNGLASQYGVNEITGIFSLVVEQICGWSAHQLKLHMYLEASEQYKDRLLGALIELKAGKPVQHVLHTAWFYGRMFEVNADVLIPRPETEELVEWVLQSLKPNAKVLEIGTGTGCIPITLKLKKVDAAVTAIDVSPAAIATARRNAANLKADILFIAQDVFTYEPDQQYDIIVSNPPYITEQEKKEMHGHVLLHEPHLALFVSDENPLRFYKAIADLALFALKEQGYLFFEINEYLGKEMVSMLEDKNFIQIELKKDMQGKDRMIRCRKG